MKIYLQPIIVASALCLLGTFAVPRLSAQKAIGGTTPDPSALLDVQSVAGGVLLPRMSIAERDAIVEPAMGLLLYNTTLNCLDLNLGTPSQPVWTCIRASNTVTSASSTPTLCVNTALTPITHATTGATGIGSVTNLPPGVSASWASNTITISGTPTAAGTYNYSIPLTGGCGSVSATGTITVQSSLTGCQVCGVGQILTFSCFNLGAAATTDPYTPRWELNGNYYQWGRAVVAAAGPTGSGSTQANSGVINGWSNASAANGAWSDVTKTANDPCPSGFRVPTKPQWDAVLNTSLNPTRSYPGAWPDGSTNYTSGLRIGSGTSGLFLPTVGYRGGIDGILVSRGINGNYWSSTENGSGAWHLGFLFYDSQMRSNSRALGLSVRCVAE